MAKVKQKSNLAAVKSKKAKHEQSHLHFAMTSRNYVIIGIGIALIILGYVIMNQNSVDGFMPTTVAPILLVLGYCIVVPVGILYSDRSAEVIPAEASGELSEETKNTVKAVSSNVRTN